MTTLLRRYAALPAWVLADAALCYAGLAGGASVRVSQAASFVVLAVGGGLYHWRTTTAAPQPAPPRPWLQWPVIVLLTLSLRSGLIELLTHVWAWPGYAAVLPAAAVSGGIMRLRRALTADAPWRAWVPGLVAYAFALRLVYSAQVELMPEEAYYWNYSRHLDFGYLDHPPMVAWLIRGGTLLFGDTEFGVRFGAICCGALASLFVFRLTRNVFGDACAWLALAMAQILPFFFLSGMLMTPDAPLTAAWAASLYFFERALVAGRGRCWSGAGLAMGLGLLSKYTIGLLGAAILSFTVLDPPSRRWLRRAEPYAAVLIAAAVFTPVIVWNAQHEWASFAFQTSRRLAEPARFSLHKLIGGALVLLTPTGLLAVGVALIGRAAGARPAVLLLKIAVLVPLTVFAVFSLRHEVKLDWTGAPWVAALPLMAFGLAERQSAGAAARRLQAAWPATWVAMLLVYGLGFYHLTAGIPGLGLSTHTELLPVAWRDFGRQIDALAGAVQTQDGEDVLVVGMDRYVIASERAFYSRDQARAVADTSSWHLFGEMGLMYSRWFPAPRQTGRTLLLVAFDPGNLAAALLAAHVESLEPMHEGLLLRDGGEVRRYYYRIARGYR
jgi:dolichol-phosphate mannosyltransferase